MHWLYITCSPPSISCPRKWGMCDGCCQFSPVGPQGSDTGRALPVSKGALHPYGSVSLRLTEACNSGTPFPPPPRDGPLPSAPDLPSTHRDHETHSPTTPPGPPKKGENRAEASMILPRGALSGTSQRHLVPHHLQGACLSLHLSLRTATGTDE